MPRISARGGGGGGEEVKVGRSGGGRGGERAEDPTRAPGASGAVAERIPGHRADRPRLLGARRVLVTGHTGFKGAWLALWLQSLGAR